MDQNQNLCESDFETALTEARADLAAGRVVRENPKEHLVRLDTIACVLRSSTKNSARFLQKIDENSDLGR